MNNNESQNLCLLTCISIWNSVLCWKVWVQLHNICVPIIHFRIYVYVCTKVLLCTSTMNKISYITKIWSTCIFALLLLSYKNALNINSTLQSDPLIPKVRNCLLLWHWTINNIRNTKFMKINKLYPAPWTYKSLNTFKTLYMHDFEFVLC